MRDSFTDTNGHSDSHANGNSYGASNGDSDGIANCDRAASNANATCAEAYAHGKAASDTCASAVVWWSKQGVFKAGTRWKHWRGPGQCDFSPARRRTELNLNKWRASENINSHLKITNCCWCYVSS
jgi:hypothetical protein